jgi:hypothetical protein
MATKKTSSSVHVRSIDVVSAPGEKCMPLLMQVENNCSPKLVVVLFCSCNFASVRLRPSRRAHGICAAVPKSAKARYIDWLHAPWVRIQLALPPTGQHVPSHIKFLSSLLQDSRGTAVAATALHCVRQQLSNSAKRSAP